MSHSRGALLTAVVVGLTACGQAELSVEQAWLRPLPPGMSMTAGYARLSNPTEQSIEFCSVRSAAFADLELHRTEIIDGVSRMRQQHTFEIGPGKQITLEPGGLHLMLMNPQQPITVGQTVEFELAACDGRRWTVLAEVRSTLP